MPLCIGILGKPLLSEHRERLSLAHEADLVTITRAASAGVHADLTAAMHDLGIRYDAGRADRQVTEPQIEHGVALEVLAVGHEHELLAGGRRR